LHAATAATGGVYATVDAVLSGVAPNEKLASQTRFEPRGWSERLLNDPFQRECAPPGVLSGIRLAIFHQGG
jgi:hypothetical protein